MWVCVCVCACVCVGMNVCTGGKRGKEALRYSHFFVTKRGKYCHNYCQLENLAQTAQKESLPV